MTAWTFTRPIMTDTDETSKRHRILLVEDDEFIKSSYDRLIQEMSVELVCANDGAEALNVLKEDNFELIILDLILPRMDGFVFLEKIKSMPETKNIPVLVLSNLGSKADISRAMDLGADDYFVKANHTLKEIAFKIKRYIPGLE